MSLVSRRTCALVAVCLLVFAPLAACNSPSAPSQIDVSLDTFSIQLSSTMAKAGEITFHVTNDAVDVPHEIVLVLTNMAAIAGHYRAGMFADLNVVP